jgi:hypothetical protein
MAVLLMVESVPGNARKAVLTMTDAGFEVSGSTIGWDEIDRVRYLAVDSHVNGSYLGTAYTVAVGTAAKKHLSFTLNSGTTGALKSKVDHERRERNRVEWSRAVELVEERAGLRIMTDAAAAVLNGVAVDFAGLRLDRQGIHKRGLFSKTVEWADLTGTEVVNHFIHIRRGTRSVIQVPRHAWNAVLLGRVVSTLRQRLAG